jgi:hypothetical protein
MGKRLTLREKLDRACVGANRLQKRDAIRYLLRELAVARLVPSLMDTESDSVPCADLVGIAYSDVIVWLREEAMAWENRERSVEGDPRVQEALTTREARIVEAAGLSPPAIRPPDDRVDLSDSLSRALGALRRS